ncbi:NAD(P)-binding rossmann-like domain-containing protein [Sarocladium implicatum]|nr:NAD(P)-binding rossmann-like domain-containing protein [Sarocladium implicatum]
MRHSDRDGQPVRVAVIGTGLAGLTTAHLLHTDERKRFEVTVFERAHTLSFDSQSVAVKNLKNGTAERVDLPMRAAAGGYYANLMRLYHHLSIPMHPVRFLFVFAQAIGLSSCATPPSGKLEDRPDSYFVHTSNLHSIPPPKPRSRGLALHIWETLFLIVCYAWFSIACFLVRPYRASSSDTYGDNDATEETVEAYLRRICIPKRYVSHYLLPLMSSVSTCSHAELLAFPASDIVNYKKLTHGQQHYTVCGGVNTVQARLAQGLTDIRMGAVVTKVSPCKGAGGVTVQWMTETSEKSSGPSEEVFDRVVLAVSPDVAARLFEAIAEPLAQIPTIEVSSSVIAPKPLLSEKGSDHILSEGGHESEGACMHHSGSTSPAQRIMLRTSFEGRDARTEALHVMPSGVTVSTCPLVETFEHGQTLKTARFTRTIRSTASQAAVKRLMRCREPEVKRSDDWVNGDDGVWLTGAWCWDGMVLLEGCVVSAMQVARDFGVDIPWERQGTKG